MNFRTAVLLSVAVSCAGVACGADNVVLLWNEAALTAVRSTSTPPPIASRALAIAHTCMYDAWAAYDSMALGVRTGATLRRPAGQRTEENRATAVSFAAYRALVDLFPREQASFDALMQRLRLDQRNTSTDPSTPAGVGNAAAQAVLEFRHRDGSNQLGDLAPGAYSDYTGYKPVNSGGVLTDPNHWLPLTRPDGGAQVFLAPHWRLVRPFALASSSEYRPGPAPLYDNDLFRERVEDIVRLSAGLNDRTKMIAEYWEDGGGSVTPPGHWHQIAQNISRRDGHTLDESVKLFFILSNASMDAAIAAWDAKVHYDCVRPITAVRYLYKGKTIDAWAGPRLGIRPVSGDNWQPYLSTPPFSEYVSGHSTFSAAAAEVLKLFTGSDAFGVSVTLPPGSSRFESGETPSEQVTLYWATFSDAADQAGMSRRYGGIHFEDADIRGRIMGRQIGRAAFMKGAAYIAGATAGSY